MDTVLTRSLLFIKTRQLCVSVTCVQTRITVAVPFFVDCALSSSFSARPCLSKKDPTHLCDIHVAIIPPVCVLGFSRRPYRSTSLRVHKWTITRALPDDLTRTFPFARSLHPLRDWGASAAPDGDFADEPSQGGRDQSGSEGPSGMDPDGIIEVSCVASSPPIAAPTPCVQRLFDSPTLWLRIIGHPSSVCVCVRDVRLLSSCQTERLLRLFIFCLQP